MRTASRFAQAGAVIVLTGGVVGADLLLKWRMTDWLGLASTTHAWWLIDEWVGFEYARNSGAAFGAFRGNPDMLAGLSILVAIGFCWLISREVMSPKVRIVCMGLLVGGAIGNLIERIRHGYVTDFIAIGPWPRFNLADSAVTVAVILFFLAVMVQPEDRIDDGGAASQDVHDQGRTMIDPE